MVNVKCGFLTGLGQSAVLASVIGALSDGLCQGLRNVGRHASVVGRLVAGYAKSKQRQHICEIHKALGLNALVVTEVFASVLFVEEVLQSLLDAFGHLESRQVAREQEANIESWFSHASNQ